MPQPSVLQPLGGPLAGTRLEFRGGDVVIGSAADCGVRLDLPGVEAHHARIVIDVTGAVLHRVDGIVGVNDDLVLGDALLRSGDFVWIGDPGGPSSIMLQFTLGDVEEMVPAAAAGLPVPDEEVLVEEMAAEELVAESPVEELLVEEGPLEATVDEAPVDEATVDEATVEEPAVHAAEPEPEIVEMAEDFPEAGPLDALTDEPVSFHPHDDEIAEIAPAELEHVAEIERSFDEPEPAELTSASSFTAPAPVVPPAPWQTTAAAAPEAAPAQNYGSAWESAAPVAKAPESVEPAAVAAPPPPPPPAPARPVPPPPAAAKRAAPPAPPRATAKTGEHNVAALRSPPPPPPAVRSSSSAPMMVGGLAVVLLAAGVGYFFMKPAPTPAPPPLTPRSTPVAVTTPSPAIPAPTVEPAVVAVVEPTPQAPAPAVATPATPATPSPRVAATPSPRATPSLIPTPSPRVTPTPAGARAAAAPAPAAAAPVAAPAAPVSQAPRLLDEARAAAAARDLPRASQLLDQVLKLEPGNGEATARKAEVDVRLAALGRKFNVGGTAVLGGKAAKKGPTGFDLGGGAAVKTDFSAQIRCATTPAALETGVPYSVRCTILNIGTKAFKIESTAANETIDGAKSTGAGTAPRQDIAPQADAVILERSGTWSAKSQWSLELVAKTNKDESFRAVYSWR